MASGTVSPGSPEYLTAVDQNEDKTMMTMTSLSGFMRYQKTPGGGESTESTSQHAAHSAAPGMPVTAAVVRTALIGVSIYQSKALRQCVCVALLFLILLILWLILRMAYSGPSSTQAATTTTTISVDIYDPITDATEKPDGVNRTMLLYDIDALSLLNDMTVPNHVLDIDSFSEAAR
ncbi:hypothetical protein V5799_015964 [Amblyomma americanum]|uniref:Uncharacterized protein n=1 Tax=Amblyomma americanum TaxID=6943 RepID=A0AAQ4F736_AMBAM